MIKVLCVASSGGHLSELKQLKIDNCKKIIVTEESKLTILDDVDYYLKYGSRSNKFSYFKVFCSNLYRAFKIINQEKPDLIISTGAHSCVPFFYVGKIFKVKTIYVESYAKVTEPSLTYKLIKNLCDVVIVQHKQLLPKYPEAIYLGSVY